MVLGLSIQIGSKQFNFETSISSSTFQKYVIVYSEQCLSYVSD